MSTPKIWLKFCINRASCSHLLREIIRGLLWGKNFDGGEFCGVFFCSSSWKFIGTAVIVEISWDSVEILPQFGQQTRERSNRRLERSSSVVEIIGSDFWLIKGTSLSWKPEYKRAWPFIGIIVISKGALINCGSSVFLLKELLGHSSNSWSTLVTIYQS